MTTALAWGFVVAIFLWQLGYIGPWLALGFFAGWLAGALIDDEYHSRRANEFWDKVTIVEKEQEK